MKFVTKITHAPVLNRYRFGTVQGSAPQQNPEKKEATAIRWWSFTLLASLLLALVFLIDCEICNGQSSDTSIRRDGKLDFLRADSSVIASINIEIAQTPESRERGLMGRELSDFSNGMLFVYQDVEPRNFWMHNTPTSLDIIFVGEDSCVVNIAPKTTPMSDQIYSSKVPVKYVVEVKAGFTEQCGIKEGIKISWGKL